MKRGTPDHPKTQRLVRALGVCKAQACGHLEMLWHWTTRFALRGDIGKFEDAEIEAGAGWEGKPGALVAALVTSGYVDRDEQYRLVVHDWHEHMDDAARKALKRLGLEPVRTTADNGGHLPPAVAVPCQAEPEKRTPPVPPADAVGKARPGVGLQAAVARLERRARELGLAHGRRELKGWRRLLLGGEAEDSVAAQIDQAGAELAAAREERQRDDTAFLALAEQGNREARDWIDRHGGDALVARSAADWIRRRHLEHPGETFAASMIRWLDADDGGPVPRRVLQLLSIEIQKAFRRAA